MNVISLMTKSELFAGVDSATLERLRESATEHRLRRGDKLFEENDTANDLYIVTSGRIAIANKSIDGRESMVALMESGDLFGEMPLFDSLGRSAEARRSSSRLSFRFPTSRSARSTNSAPNCCGPW